MHRNKNRIWIEHLADEDLAFIRRFVLASGSLKEIARVYGISYPTVRLRLDRLINKIQFLEETDGESGFERMLKAAFVDGMIDRRNFERLLEAHHKELEERPR